MVRRGHLISHITDRLKRINSKNNTANEAAIASSQRRSPQTRYVQQAFPS